MLVPRHSKLKPEPEREHESKQRRCLMCRKLFMSDWMGERICPLDGDLRAGLRRRRL
jgi:hypothetical protein